MIEQGTVNEELIIVDSIDRLAEVVAKKSSSIIPMRSLVNFARKKLEKKDYRYFELAELNMLLIYRNNKVRRKFGEFLEIVKAIHNMPPGSYALIKVNPFISNLGYDVDLLVDKCYVAYLIRKLKNFLPVKNVNGKLNKGFNIRIEGFETSIDIYTFIGWRGLKVLDTTYCGKPLKYISEPRQLSGHTVFVINRDIDLLIQVAHLFESKGWMSLSDLLKMMILLADRDLCGDTKPAYNKYLKLYLNPWEICAGIKLLLSDAMSRVEELISKGRIRIPLNQLALFSLPIIFYNIKEGNINFKGFYWEVERLFLEVIQRCFY